MPYSDPERRKENYKRYYEKHKEQIKKRKREAWRKAFDQDPEKFRERSRKFREKHPEKVREYNKKYRRENQELNRRRQREWQRKWRRENLEAAKTYGRKKHLKRRIRKTGLTEEKYTKRASSGCGICGKKVENLAIDHCHDTGEFRDLLCSQCNTMLGMAADSPNVLEEGARYIRRHAAEELNEVAAS